MLFPVSILPDWLQFVAHLNPVTYSLDAMRGALLAGARLRQIAPAVAILLLFALILLPASIWGFSWALRRTKITGTLSHR
jgi:ABC-2 type transport system permease protein